MDPNIETLFKAVPAFEESKLYCCPEYEQANSITSKVSDILAELRAGEVVNLYYFQQGYLAAKTRCQRAQKGL